MSYTGTYHCPVTGCLFEVNVTGDRLSRANPGERRTLERGNSGAARAAVVQHGYAEHQQDWNGTGNEVFVRSEPSPA